MKPRSYSYPVGQILDELVSEEPKKRLAACENMMEVAKAMGKEKAKNSLVPFLRGR
jgi:hypothetical protein